MDFRHLNHPADRAQLALELTMRDALGGLAELVCLDAYGFEPDCLEILSIERPVSAQAGIPARYPHAAASAEILSFPERRRCVG
ncbi:MAG: hypothetical protein ABR553_03840 [Gammaproteobacteria bacterium]